MPVLSESPVKTSQINGLTRRKVISGTAGLVTLTSFGGPRAAAKQASSTASGTRIIDTIYGPVEIPAKPQRVVAITYIAAIAVAELGLMPAGVTRWVPDLPPSFPDLSAIAKIENEAYELDLEAVAALKPDLIIGADALAASDRNVPYDQLTRIAPTALFEWGSGGSNWEVQAAGCAEALGKTAEFAELRAAYDKNATEIKTAYVEVLSALTVDFIDAGDSEWYLHGPASTHCKVAIEAGVSLGAGANQEETFTGFSFEQLNMLEGTDALITRGGALPSLDTLNALPNFKTLPAVSGGRVLSSGYFYVASYAQANALLAELEGGLKTLSGL
jgi:iron complex transport system substrate-binding protein